MKEFLAFKEVYFPLGHMYHYISECPPPASWTLDELICLIARFWRRVRNQEHILYYSESLSNSKVFCQYTVHEPWYLAIIYDMD